jgi:hypothetical protein
MSAGDPTTTSTSTATNKAARKQQQQQKKTPASRKPPPRWRKYLVQAELELPPPAPGTRERASAPDERKDDDDIETATEMPGATDLAWWQTTPVVLSLVLACVLLAGLTGWSLYRAARDRAAAVAAEARVTTLTLRAISSERTLRITPNPRSWSARPDATIEWPEPPQLLELQLPVGYSSYLTFALVIDKVDHGRVMVVEHLAPDSNRELRLAVNSSAFGPGEYRLRLQGHTWRGERVDAGWARLVVAAPH